MHTTESTTAPAHADVPPTAPPVQTPSDAPQVKDRAAYFNSSTLARAQARVALVTVVLPIVGLVGGIVAIAVYGVSPFYLALWGGMHLVGMLGISVGFHRLGAHRSFKPHPWVARALYIMGSLSAQGPVIYWVSNHRRHHEKCDRAGDVHSPYYAEDGEQFSSKLNGFWQAHTGWMFRSNPTNPLRYSRDLLKDRDACFVNRHYMWWIALGIVVPGVIALAVFHTVDAFLLGMLFGGLARLCSVQHVTWAINSWTHMFGRRPFVTQDRSSNAAWLCVPTVGEAWHNNHHAFPYSARLGLMWWQLDIGWMLLVCLRAVGLVRDVKLPTRQAMRDKRVAPSPS